MAAVMAIIIGHLQLKYRKVCAGQNLWDFFIFYIKLAYNDATKSHISNFQKIKHGCRYGNNYQ